MNKVLSRNIPEPLGDMFINLLISLYSVLCTLFSDWLSQALAEIMKLEKSSSWTMVLVLAISIISTLALKVGLDKTRDKNNTASGKVFLLGNSFSMILGIRVLSPCWVDCLSCETQDPTALIIKGAVAFVPFLFASGLAYQSRNLEFETADIEVNKQWLNFKNKLDHRKIITQSMFNSLRSSAVQPPKEIVRSDEEIKKYYEGVLHADISVTEIREQMSLFVIEIQEHGWITHDRHHYHIFLKAEKDHWVIIAYLSLNE